MIKTVADFLDCLREKENAALKQQDITHPPTISDMYEGLTHDLLNRAFPPSAGIDVTAGFITDNSGTLSDELDCMVVMGTGQEVPYTNKRKYVIDDVVAVVQVKKNLYSSDLRSGYGNLLSVTKFDPSRDRRAVLLRDAFQTTTRRPLPSREQLPSLPYEIQLIYQTLVMELVYPARIIFGYNGFKSQSALRRSFVDFLSAQMTTIPAQGFGVPSMPSLISCGRHSIVKANGMPFCSPMEEDGFWPVLGSTSTNPIELLLQVVWTRLVYDRKLPATLFDDDAFLQPMARFIDARPTRIGDQGGWMYRVTNASPKVLEEEPEPSRWEPVIVDQTQFVILNRLCGEERIQLNDPDLANFLSAGGYTVGSFVQSLNNLGLAARDGDTLVLLTRGCTCAILPDGRFAVAENVAGQFTRWMMDFMKDRRKAQPSPPPYGSPAAGSPSGEA